MNAALPSDLTREGLNRETLRREGTRLNALVALADPMPAQEGTLSGLTFVAKDMFSWPGHAMSRGLAVAQPDDGQSALLLKQLTAEGAALLGFSEMTPLAYEPSGGNLYRARPLNPLNADYVCGGSSSGSAVLVAAGLVDFAVGSDTAGSLRIPAHCCGVAAWKPSFGLFCRAGSWPLAPSLDTLGFLARDIAMLLRVGQALVPERPQGAMRIAIADDLIWPNEDDHKRIKAAVATLHPTSVSLQSVIELCDDVVLTLLQREAYLANQKLLEAGALDPVLTRRLSHGATISPETYAAAYAGLSVLRAQTAEQLFEKVDVIVLPTMPHRTPRVTACEPSSPDFSARALYDLSRYTRFVNALGLPAVTLPLPAQDGAMPSSVQLIARHGSGLAILHAARTIETLLQENAR